VSGSSVAPSAPAGTTVASINGSDLSDGVLGQGKNGVHGVSPWDNGVLGENTAGGCGVSGASVSGTGVYGENGAGSGTTPKFGCGVRGESANGYGVYGASKTASGVYGTSGSGSLAGEFVGDVRVTGNCTVSGNVTAAAITAGPSASGSPAGKFVGDVSISGNCTVSGNATAATITAGDIILTGADCAEEFDSSRAEGIEPGSVVVFENDGALNTSDQPYNKRVAGVISGAGNYRAGVILDRRISDRARASLALVGKVYCKVDARYGVIEVGDLLTTSATAGHAMKATNSAQAFGAVIGKALAPCVEGRGLIPILVTLQ